MPKAREYRRLTVVDEVDDQEGLLECLGEREWIEDVELGGAAGARLLLDQRRQLGRTQ